MRSKKGYYYETRIVCACCGADVACDNEFLEEHCVSWAGPDADFEFFDWGAEMLRGDVPSEYTRYWHEEHDAKSATS